jgi:hypothetical protein
MDTIINSKFGFLEILHVYYSAAIEKKDHLSSGGKYNNSCTCAILFKKTTTTQKQKKTKKPTFLHVILHFIILKSNLKRIINVNSVYFI